MIGARFGQPLHASGIVRYDLHRTTGATCSATAPRVHSGSARTYRDTAVTAGTRYRYCVLAVAGDGARSALSNTVAATDIDKLATAGITLGCGGDRFCPGEAVRRQQMAAFLRRGLTP